jgi:dTDP-4-dehydrorhamnose reductase
MKTNDMTIVIFGADGQLGMDLCDALSGYAVEPLVYPDMDVRDRAHVGRILDRIRPDWVINSAAFTHVDLCEDSDLTAFQVNALGAKHIAEKCRTIGARMIQISTDYVFDGKKTSPYIENDPTGPLNVYGVTKLTGERFVSRTDPENIIVRTSGLYGVHPCWGKGRNFVDTMLALADEKDILRVVDDETLTPTFTEDLAAVVQIMVEEAPAGGIYHATNSGACSWFGFARAIFDLSRAEIRLEKTTAAEWSAPAKRPAYSVLENDRMESAGLGTMPRWEDALGRYLKKKHPRR